MEESVKNGNNPSTREEILKLLNCEIHDEVLKIAGVVREGLKDNRDLKVVQSKIFDFFYDLQYAVYTRLNFDYSENLENTLKSVLDDLRKNPGNAEKKLKNLEFDLHTEIKEVAKKDEKISEKVEPSSEYFRNLVRQREEAIAANRQLY